jgi:peptidoglycan-associated lipoprotein
MIVAISLGGSLLKSIFLPACLLFLLNGCTTKKTAPVITDKPMAFNPQGSDSKSIEGLNSIGFDFNGSSLGKSEKETLAKNAEWIKNHSGVQVQIEGHCDNRGSTEYNLALGERRAKAAYNYLVNLGVNPKQLSTISYGKERPLAFEDTDEARAQNRRGNFVPSQNK